VAEVQDNILLIGAGAVGQAYGYHLAEGGAQVTFLVKEKYVSELTKGLTVRCLNDRHSEPVTFRNYSVTASIRSQPPGGFQQVWFCIDSTATTDHFLEHISAHVGDATIVSLQPGIHDFTRFKQVFDQAQLVRGMITLVSFEQSVVNPGTSKAMCWWFPPFSRAPFEGNDDLVDLITSRLRRGRMPATQVHDLEFKLRLGSGILMPMVAMLELCDWQLSKLRRTSNLVVAARAARQAIAITLPGRARIRVRFLTAPLVLLPVLFLAQTVTPFHLQNLLRVHFSKVRRQTLSMLDQYIEMAVTKETEMDSIETIRNGLRRRDVENNANDPSSTCET
tara:strand:- start:2841 stop:3845 length:1005 start_codon:yes stop_codon:yes gene_type:complete